MLTDSGGNYAYFVPAAYYTECVTGARVTGVCYAVNAMGSGVLTNVANVFTALQTFSAGFSSAGPSTLNGTLTIGATGNTGPLTLGVGALGANLFTGNQTAPAFISSSANPSGTGFLRMATGDFIGMRDTNNAFDMSLKNTTIAFGNTPINTLNMVNFAGLIAPFFGDPGATSAGSGEFRMPANDIVCWRNNGNTADNCLGQTAGNVLTYTGIPLSVNVTGDFTTANNTNLQAITGLTWTMPANSVLTVPFSCHLSYSQATGNVADQFGIQDVTVAPTNIFAKAQVYISASTFTAANLPLLSTTTATSIVTFTPSAITTIWNADIDGFIEQPSNAGTTAIQIMVQTSNGADAVTIKRGSFCRVN